MCVRTWQDLAAFRAMERSSAPTRGDEVFGNVGVPIFYETGEGKGTPLQMSVCMPMSVRVYMCAPRHCFCGCTVS